MIITTTTKIKTTKTAPDKERSADNIDAIDVINKANKAIVIADIPVWELEEAE